MIVPRSSFFNMTQEIQNVIVLGATGNLGPHILSALLAAGFSVKVLSRNQLSASAVVSTGVEVLQSDYSFESLVDAFKGQHAVISTVTTSTVQQQLKIIDAAAAAKVKRFLPSEFGSDTSVDDDDAIEAFLKDKQEVVRYLRTKESEGLSWTALCPGAWVDWMLEEGQAEVGIDRLRNRFDR
ncbi:NmrA-like domain-containing protein [Nemania serpens]|nr:NmrA-like domain-containing protein [Nemania serpens]